MVALFDSRRTVIPDEEKERIHDGRPLPTDEEIERGIGLPPGTITNQTERVIPTVPAEGPSQPGEGSV